MARKQFILLAGVDYRNFEIDHAALCLLRVNELVADHKGTADLKFLLYDFKGGTITTINVPKRGLREAPIVEKRFNKITKKDYPDFVKGESFNLLNEAIKDVMTIAVVYNEIIGIGKDFPGELIEWSFFCNQFFISPDLTNSTSDDAIRGNKKAFKKLPKDSRDPDEPDPDFSFDFKPPNMGSVELEFFKKAFNKKEGYCWLWCTPWYIPDEMLLTFKFLETIKELNDPSLPDDTIVDLKGIPKKALERIEYLTDYLPKKIFNPKSPKVPLDLLRTFICTQARVTAANRLANIIDVKAYGTFDDMPVEFDKTNKTLPIVSPAYEQMRQFVKKQLGIRDAPQGNFLEFPPGIPCKKYRYTEPGIKPASSPATQPVAPTPASKPVIPFTSDSPLLKPDTILSRLGTYQRHYVFVAGVDYKSSGTNFFELCTNRVNHIIENETNRDPILFQVLDFGSGEVTYFEVFYKTGTTQTNGFVISTEDRHAEVKITKDEFIFFGKVKVDVDYSAETDAMGETEFFFKAKEPVMTVNEIYRRVIEIGKNSPGRLIELSFFSHGEESGPQLLHFREPAQEEFESAIGTAEESEINDDHRFFDPSPYFDFDPPLMTGDDLADFQKAFHQNGYSWVWGYDTNPELRKLLKAVIESKEYKAAGLTEDTMITLRNPTPRLRLFVQRVGKLVKGDDIPPVKIQLPFGLLLRYFAAVLKSSYMYHLARISGKDVYGGLPGVTASKESGIKNPLMAISPAFNKYSKFFREHFGFDFDSEIRGYGKYIPDFPWENSDLAGVRIEEEILDEVKAFPVE